MSCTISHKSILQPHIAGAMCIRRISPLALLLASITGISNEQYMTIRDGRITLPSPVLEIFISRHWRAAKLTV
jgi:hypothetical protein